MFYSFDLFLDRQQLTKHKTTTRMKDKTTTSSTTTMERRTGSHPRMESHNSLCTFLLLLLYRMHVFHNFADLIKGIIEWLSVFHRVVCRVGVPLKQL